MDIQGLPEALGWYRKQEDIHLLNRLFIWDLWSDSMDIGGKDMILQVSQIAMVRVKVFDPAKVPGPDVDIMCTVTEVICEATTKVARAEHEDLGRRRGHGWGSKTRVFESG